ncbi:MAG: fumarylacetoacetate hydrolase family protein [Alphaproteobacteria bacterium]
MALSNKDIEKEGAALYQAMQNRTTLAPLTERLPGITIDDAYQISLHYKQLREGQDGEKVVGKKIGVTSAPVQEMLGVFEPDFGFLMDAMHVRDGKVAMDSLIAPRAEAEIAFRLKKDLRGPGITPEDVLDATECVMACFEIVDSRIKDWQIKIEDTVADNASCGVFLIGPDKVDPRGIDLAAVTVEVTKNGKLLSQGIGSSVQGSPLASVAWLANTLGRYDIPFKAGEVILSGSLVPLEPVQKGDHMRMMLSGIGALEVDFI